MKVLFGVTVPITAYAFLTGQVRSLVDAGLDVHVACSTDDAVHPGAWARSQGAVFHPVPIARRPGVGDLTSLRRLITLMQREKPDVAVLSTPKMGLLGLMAARATRVPRRVYLVHGLRYEGASGVGRRALIATEQVAARLATEVVAVSPSVAAGLQRIGVQAQVLGHGSANGIDTQRFSPPTVERRVAARHQLDLPMQERVVLFVGRLTADKGLSHLAALASRLPTEPGTTLLVVGDDETRTDAERRALDVLRSTAAVRLLAHRKDIETLYAAADLLVLPTRREGLGNVILEAAACEVPCVATRSTGVVDAIAQGMTGILVDRSDPSVFVEAVLSLLHDPARRARMGAAARHLVQQRFAQDQVWQAWLRFLTMDRAAVRLADLRDPHRDLVDTHD